MMGQSFPIGFYWYIWNVTACWQSIIQWLLPRQMRVSTAVVSRLHKSYASINTFLGSTEDYQSQDPVSLFIDTFILERKRTGWEQTWTAPILDQHNLRPEHVSVTAPWCRPGACAWSPATMGCIWQKQDCCKLAVCLSVEVRLFRSGLDAFASKLSGGPSPAFLRFRMLTNPKFQTCLNSLLYCIFYSVPGAI